MADAYELRILRAVKSALEVASVVTSVGTVTKPTGLTVHRARLRPTQHDKLPSLVVYKLPSAQPPDWREAGSGRISRPLRVGVEMRVKVASITAPDDDLSVLWTWAIVALTADPTLGGLCQDLNEGETDRWEFDEEEIPYGIGATAFDIVYETLATNPTST